MHIGTTVEKKINKKKFQKNHIENAMAPNSFVLLIKEKKTKLIFFALIFFLL